MPHCYLGGAERVPCLSRSLRQSNRARQHLRVCALCSRHLPSGASSSFAETISVDFDNGGEMSMKTKAASKDTNESYNIHTALGGAGEPASNDTATRLGRDSVMARTNAAIGVYWGSIARTIEFIYLLAAFGVLGSIPPLFDVAITCARYLITWMRRLQAQLTDAISIPPKSVIGLLSRRG
jgi:hypothetical protein